MGVSHEIIRKDKFELSIDTDQIEEDNQEFVDLFCISLGTGFNKSSDFNCVNIEIANLTLEEIIDVHKRIGEVIEEYRPEFSKRNIQNER